MRMKLEIHGLGFQTLCSYPEGRDFPWLSYKQFGNLVGFLTDMIVAAWEMRAVEDYDDKFSFAQNDFMRKWHHNRSGKSIPLDQMMAKEDGDVFETADFRLEFEQDIMTKDQPDSSHIFVAAVFLCRKEEIGGLDHRILSVANYIETHITDELDYQGMYEHFPTVS